MTEISRKAPDAPDASAMAPTNRLQEVRNLIAKLGSRFSESIAANRDERLLVSIAFTAIRSNPRLLECSAASIVACMMQANQVGLRLDGPLGHAYMVPYRNKKKNLIEAQFMIGYRGLLDLARRSGEINGVSAGVVYEKDEFECEHGFNERLVHKPAMIGDRGKPTASYAWARLKSGAFIFEVMSTAEVEKVRQRSRAKDEGPWISDWPEMARKTVTRRLMKYLPISAQVAESVDVDDRTTRGIPTSFDVDTRTGEIFGEIESDDLPAAQVEEHPERREDAAATPAVVDGFGAKQTAALTAEIETAKDLPTLAKIMPRILAAMDGGEITARQDEDLRAAFEAVRKRLIPARPAAVDKAEGHAQERALTAEQNGLDHKAGPGAAAAPATHAATRHAGTSRVLPEA